MNHHQLHLYSGFTRWEEGAIRLLFGASHAWGSALVARHLFSLSHWLFCLPFYLFGLVASVQVAHYLFARFMVAREVLRRFKAFEYVIDIRVKPFHLVKSSIVLSIGSYFIFFPLTYTVVRCFRWWYLSLETSRVEVFFRAEYWLVISVFTVLFIVLYPLFSRLGKALLQNDLHIRMCQSPEEFLPALQEAKFNAERTIERLMEEERLTPFQVVHHEPEQKKRRFFRR